MKVYISVDFEGVAGSTSWSSTNLGDLEHGPMAREMTWRQPRHAGEPWQPEQQKST